MVKSSIFFYKNHGLTPLENFDFLGFFETSFLCSKMYSFLSKIYKENGLFWFFFFLNGLTHIVFNYFHFDGCPFSIDLGYKSKTRNRIKLNLNEDKILCNNHCSILCFFRVRMETTKATCFCMAVFYVLTFGMWSAQATSEGANSLFLFSSTINY